MSTTAGDPSTLKTPPTLSGGDLVSRLLAATPPYLYNVPLTPHSFFFSEMLRSFVQAKAEASTVVSGPPPPPRRRKRSWRDVRDRPLELTTNKERSTSDKYFRADGHSDQKNRYSNVQHSGMNFDGNKTGISFGATTTTTTTTSPTTPTTTTMTKTEESKSDFCRHKNYFDDRQSFGSVMNRSSSRNSLLNSEPKVKPEESLSADQKLYYTDGSACDEAQKSSSEESFPGEQKNKLDLTPSSFAADHAGRGGDVLAHPKNFALSPDVANPDLMPGPMWYPPYPMPQTYPGIDPFHFFIDLRVSGHIWDRKLAERQPSFKGKHSSAFSVPQTREHNRPLNLTRDEASTSRTKDENATGTHYILKNLTKTYKGIRGLRKSSNVSDPAAAGDVDASEVIGRMRDEDSDQFENRDSEKKDIRALIGLELVVDYVKDPKTETAKPENSPRLSEYATALLCWIRIFPISVVDIAGTSFFEVFSPTPCQDPSGKPPAGSSVWFMALGTLLTFSYTGTRYFSLDKNQREYYPTVKRVEPFRRFLFELFGDKSDRRIFKEQQTAVATRNNVSIKPDAECTITACQSAC